MMLALYCLRSLGFSSHWVLIFCCLRVPRNNPKPTHTPLFCNYFNSIPQSMVQGIP